MKNVLKLIPVAVMALTIGFASTATLSAQETATQDKVDYKTVFADYIKATGGEKAHRSIKSVISKGTIEIAMVGLEGETEMKQKGEKALLVVNLPGVGTQTVGSDGETFWQISEMTGPEIMEGAQRSQMKREMAPVSTYINADEKYDEIEYVGVEEFDGEDCHVVKTKCEGEEEETHYFSVESKLLIGRKGTQDTPQGAMEITTMMDDYKEVNGMKMPHTSTVEFPNGMSMVTKTEEVKVNVEIDDDTFKLPTEIQELKDDE